jgi:hypothetical protein
VRLLLHEAIPVAIFRADFCHAGLLEIGLDHISRVRRRSLCHVAGHRSSCS